MKGATNQSISAPGSGPSSGTSKNEAIWSIGIYTGQTPIDLEPAPGADNPVISAEDVSDVQAEFVADPFMIDVRGTWHMFFEVMNAETHKGEIGLATSADGLAWSYARIVLKESFHLSYPYVFRLDGEYYMIPETNKSNSIRLYKADRFPDEWSLAAHLMQGAWVDCSVFHYEGRWWMFATPAFSKSSTLELFHAESIHGPWRAHPLNPIIAANNRIARPAGRVIVNSAGPIRFTQDCHPSYGTRVRAFDVLDLTPSGYRDREVEPSPVLAGGEHDWNRAGMHHVDAHSVEGGWLACVDGWRAEAPKGATADSR